MPFFEAFAQDIILPSDTITYVASDYVAVVEDTENLEEQAVELPPRRRSAIISEIRYQAADSIIFYADGRLQLFGSGQVNFEEVELIADFVEIDMNTSEVKATGVADTLGNIVGNPVFRDGGDRYESRSIRYNFNTRRGFIYYVVTQQGEGFIVSEQTMKTTCSVHGCNILFMRDGRYTTCARHYNPHFYLRLTRAKVRPNQWIVTGPAFLVFEGVPLPLAIPFGFFPFTSTYTSGIIMPSFGEEMARGFFLRDGGYYFAINDFFDLAITGDIYTRGSWALRANSSYVKRYRFRGNVSLNYITTLHGDRGSADFSSARAFNFTWRHTQDPRANPFRTLSANVSFSTSQFERNNIANLYNPEILATNNRMSSVSLSQSFPNSPWRLQMGLMATQRMQDSTINLQLPNFNASMSRVFPFRRQNAISRERWFERIHISYTGRFDNSIETREDQLRNYSFPRDWRNGFSHEIPIAATFTLFNHLNITPSFNYRARWYFSGIERRWDTETNSLVSDTIGGFRHLNEFSGSLSLNTRIFAFFRPMPFLSGGRIDAVRWVITPTASFSARPDFGAERFGYWTTYTRFFEDETYELIHYSPWERGIFGVPARGRQGALNFSLGNNVEMRVRDRGGDENATRTVSLIDNFSISASYNFMADSLNLSNFATNLRLRLTDRVRISLSANFDPYEYVLDRHGRPRRIHDFRWNHGRMPQLISTGTSFGYTINNNTFRRRDRERGREAPAPIEFDETTPATPTLQGETASLFDRPQEDLNLDDQGFMRFEMPWSLTFDYSLRYGRDGTFNEDRMQHNLRFNHDISVSGTLALTSKWHFSATLSYDITENEINSTVIRFTRNLHCWSMTGQIVPFGRFRSYMITIGVNSQLLRDLRYEQRSKSSLSVW